MSKSLTTQLKAVDFFCGAGGVTCGFNKAGITVIGGIDIDSKFKDTYQENNNAIFVNQDVSNLDPASLKKFLPIEKNDDNLIFVGCSPCQYYSNLKSDKTKSKNGRLLLEDFKEFALYYKPGFILIENVPGLKTKKGSPLQRFKSVLVKEGYVITQDVLNAKYYGVPQTRNRFILIASRITHKISLPRPNKKKEKIKTVAKAIGNLKKFYPIENGHKDISDFQHTTAKLAEINLLRVRKTPKNGGSRKAWENDKNLQLECYKNHRGHYDVYGRLYWDKPAPTLTTKFIYSSTGRYSHPEQDRAISLREGATLQSFPINYKFYSKSQDAIATMIGNAVPPKLAEAIGRTIKKQWVRWQKSSARAKRRDT